MDLPSATRVMRTTAPMPAQKKRLPFTHTYSPADYQRIARGFIPRRMEEKWFAFLEDDTLYCHRSWTGICVFEVHFVKCDNGYAVGDCWANRDPDQYKGVDDEEDASIVGFLIDCLLLGKPVQLSVHAASPEEAALRTWALFGDARSNDEPVPQTWRVIPPSSPPPDAPQDS